MKAIIEIFDGGASKFTYENSKGEIIPICEVTSDKFNISKIIDTYSVFLISKLVYDLSRTLLMKLKDQMELNKNTSNKTSNDK